MYDRGNHPTIMNEHTLYSGTVLNDGSYVYQFMSACKEQNTLFRKVSPFKGTLCNN